MKDDFLKDDSLRDNADEAKHSSGDSVAADGAGNFPPRRTAVGTADYSSPDYKVGEELECLVLHIREGGYEVLILKDGLEAYLRTSEQHEVGSVFVAQFHCWQDKKRD